MKFDVSQLKFDANGLIPAVIQDVDNGDILMVGYMNREAVEKTLEGPYVTFYSRSRNKMWIKGETSGHTQTVREIYFDCDADCLLIKAVQHVAACHTGFRGCFYRRIEKDRSITTIGEPLFTEDEVYKH